MRPLLTLASVVLVSMSVFAQKDKDIPAFGKIDKTEIDLKECSYDKNAEAVVLFDVGKLTCRLDLAGAFIGLERHVRIKILNDKGFKHADIHLPYISAKNQQSIKGLSAQTYNFDAAGNVVATKVDKKQIFEKRINKKVSEEVFTFPELKAGSIVEYKYTLDGASFNDWFFQKSIPVLISRYTVDFPNDLEVANQPYCSLPYESKKSERGTNTSQTFTMKNVPALRDEPYISADDDYLQRLQTDLIAINSSGRRINIQPTWPQVIKELMLDEDFGIQLKRDIPRTADLDAALKNVSDPYEKMRTIHYYVRKNMEWNGFTNIWAMEGVKSAWKDKKGTVGEINLILVNLLKDAGLTAHPILVSTQKNGRVITTYPSLAQFDKVMAHVKIKDRIYVLDATDKFTPVDIIPEDVMFTEGLVIEKLETFDWGWVTLWNDNAQKNSTLIRASIDEKGQMKGTASIASYDYSRVARASKLKEGRDKYIAQYLSGGAASSAVDTLEFENIDTDTLPLIQKFTFSAPTSSSGDYTYFSSNLFSGLEKNPFITDERFSDVFFGTNQEYHIVANFTIPEGYQFEELPKNIRMIMPDTSISIIRRIATEKNQLVARISLQFARPYYTPAEYPDFKEFYKKLFDLLNEQIVIRKKS